MIDNNGQCKIVSILTNLSELGVKVCRAPFLSELRAMIASAIPAESKAFKNLSYFCDKKLGSIQCAQHSLSELLCIGLSPEMSSETFESDITKSSV